MLSTGTTGSPALHVDDIGSYTAVGFALIARVDAIIAEFPHLCECEECGCPGELNDDGMVGVPDLLALLSCWGDPIPNLPECECADLTDSGTVGVPDLLELLELWGPCAAAVKWDPPESVEDCWERYSHDFELLERCIEAVQQTQQIMGE